MYLYKFSSLLLVFNIRLFILKQRSGLNNRIILLKFNYGFFKIILKYIGFLFFFKRWFFNLSNIFTFNIWTSFKSYSLWVTQICYNNYNRYRVRLQLVGLGNRIIELRRTKLLLKLGYAHLLLIYKFSKMKFVSYLRKKNAFVVYSNNFFHLNNFIYLVKRLKFPDCYNANGIRLVNEKFKLKARKKWGVF